MCSQAQGKAPASSRKRGRATQLSGLALIEELYFGLGQQAAQSHLERLLGADSRPFALSESGQASACIHLSPSDEVLPQDFSPPSHWNVSYSIQFAKLGNKEKDEYVFYPGEQLLIPVEGEIEYHFFWTPGGRAPDRALLAQPVNQNSILRVNPQVPHHAWALRGHATAWYVLRHATNSPAALVMNQESTSIIGHGSPEAARIGLADVSGLSIRSSLNRRARADDLRKSGAYAMIVWGISGAVREARLRSGMTTTELAFRVGMDPSTLLRLEETKANVSIEMLLKVCRTLHISLADRLESGSWAYEKETMDLHSKVEHEPMLDAPIGDHALHPYLVRLAAHKELAAPATSDSDPEALASWIVLEVLMDLPPKLGSRPVIVSAGSVIHFRECGVVRIQALTDSKLIHIINSTVCGCRDRMAVSSLEGSA
jgi:transcriptional regulator with XRE-family HTH domain